MTTISFTVYDDFRFTGTDVKAAAGVRSSSGIGARGRGPTSTFGAGANAGGSQLGVHHPRGKAISRFQIDNQSLSINGHVDEGTTHGSATRKRDGSSGNEGSRNGNDSISAALFSSIETLKNQLSRWRNGPSTQSQAEVSVVGAVSAVGAANASVAPGALECELNRLEEGDEDVTPRGERVGDENGEGGGVPGGEAAGGEGAGRDTAVGFEIGIRGDEVHGGERAVGIKEDKIAAAVTFTGDSLSAVRGGEGGGREEVVLRPLQANLLQVEDTAKLADGHLGSSLDGGREYNGGRDNNKDKEKDSSIIRMFEEREIIRAPTRAP